MHRLIGDTVSGAAQQRGHNHEDSGDAGLLVHEPQTPDPSLYSDRLGQAVSFAWEWEVGRVESTVQGCGENLARQQNLQYRGVAVKCKLLQSRGPS